METRGRPALRAFAPPAFLVAGVVALAGGIACGAAGPAEPAPLPVDEGELPAELREGYREDAARLAVRHRRALDQSPLGEVRVSEPLAEDLYAALVRVAAFDHPASDSVTSLYEIHTFPEPVLHRLLLGVDPDAGWTEAWRDGRRETGNPDVDGLVETYGLELERYRAREGGPDLAVLVSEDPLDIAALARRFLPIEGVVYADPDAVAGDGNDIRAAALGPGWRLEYRVGFGDCPAGCISRHTWTFRVEGDGTVTFLGSEGPPPPPVEGAVGTAPAASARPSASGRAGVATGRAGSPPRGGGR